MVAIAQGGNLAGKREWLARWKEREHPRPTHDDLEGLKNFMYMVYVKELWKEKVVSSKAKKHQVSTKPLVNGRVSDCEYSSKPSQISSPHIEDFWRNLHTSSAIEPQVSYYRYLTQSLPPQYYYSCNNLYNPYSIPLPSMFCLPSDSSKFTVNPFEALEQMNQNNKLTVENCLAHDANASNRQEPNFVSLCNNQANQNNLFEKSMTHEYLRNPFHYEDHLSDERENPFCTF